MTNWQVLSSSTFIQSIFWLFLIFKIKLIMKIRLKIEMIIYTKFINEGNYYYIIIQLLRKYISFEFKYSFKKQLSITW